MAKKGFTLMELLVAVFIGSMVTVALVSVWKGASLQTSQSQRQTIIRNNLSMFLRLIHRDITDSDILLFPRKLGETNGELVLVAGKNILLDHSSFKARPHINDNDVISTLPIAIVYCYKGNKVLRKEVSLSPGEELVTADFLDGLTCSGTNVMDYVTGIKVTTKDAVNYKLSLEVNKDFADKTSPIKLDFEQTFVISGGG